ncbi:hypothetical protein FA95DRAFT_1460102, partial [Auriscalpium vulgare]
SVHTMPPPGDDDAPKKFTGSYAKILRFIKHYENLLQLNNVTSDKEKCETILDYCSTKIARFIRTLESFQKPDWSALRADLLDQFDADRTSKRYSAQDLMEFVRKEQKKRITTITQFKEYNVKFRSIAGELRARNKIDKNMEDTHYWLGIGKSLRQKLETRMLMEDPALSLDTAFKMDLVYKTAIKLLARDRFDAHTFVDRNIDDDAAISDTETDIASDSDSDDDSDAEARELRRKTRKKKLTKKRVPKTTYDSEAEEDRYDREQVRRRTQSAPTATSRQKDVEDLITQLNGMRLDDPKYGLLYYQAIKLDEEVKQVVHAPIGPGNGYGKPAPGSVNAIPLGSNKAGGAGGYIGGRREEMICYGCGERGHGLNTCRQIAELVNQGTLIRTRTGRF